MEWPLEPGEFVVCDPGKHIVVVTLDDDLSLPEEFLACFGKSRTENLGVERVVVNCVSNPCVRVVVVCGEEIAGHMAGQAIVALWMNGIDKSRRIKGAKGAIPYIQNLPGEFIDRFRKQVRVIDLIGVVDENVLSRDIRKIASDKLDCFQGDELDFARYLLKPESALTGALDLDGVEVSLLPEYDLRYDPGSGQVKVGR